MRPESEAERGKSPLATAILISFAIAAGTVLSTLDAPIFEEITSGKWLTRSFSQAQEHNTAAIAKLEREVGTVTTDIDFVASRIGVAIQRNESAALDRFAEVEARISALKEHIAGVQATQAAGPRPRCGSERIHPAVIAARACRRPQRRRVGDHPAARPHRGDGRHQHRCHVVGKFGAAPCTEEGRVAAEPRRAPARSHLQRQAGKPAGRAAAPVPIAGLGRGLISTQP